MAFSFTRAALLDKQLEDVSIVLENALIDESVLAAAPAGDRDPADGLVARLSGARHHPRPLGDLLLPGEQGLHAARSSSGPRSCRRRARSSARHVWKGRILDSLPPDVRAATDEDVRRVQEEARSLVRASALARTRETALSAALDLRFRAREPGRGALRRARRRAALRRRRVLACSQGGSASPITSRKASSRSGWQRADGSRTSASGLRLVSRRGRRARDLAAPEHDRGPGARQRLHGPVRRPRRLADPRSWTGALAGAGACPAATNGRTAWSVHATPGVGPIRAHNRCLEAPRAAGRAWRSSAPRRWRWAVFEVAVGRRASRAARALGRRCRLATSDDRRSGGPGSASRPSARSARSGSSRGPSIAGAIGSDLPPQEFVYLGGPTSAPGYEFHELVGRFGASQRVEGTVPDPVSGDSRSVGTGTRGEQRRSLRSRTRPTRAASSTPAPGERRAGWYPAVGVGLLTVFDLLRFDVAKGLRDGRWTFSVDVIRDFWSIL